MNPSISRLCRQHCLSLTHHQDMQEKTDDMAKEPGNLGLRLNSKKTKHMKINAARDDAFRLNSAKIGEVEVFTYLSAKMSTIRDSEVKIRPRFSKARQAFASLRNARKSRIICKKTKICICKSNVLSTSCMDQNRGRWPSAKGRS